MFSGEEQATRGGRGAEQPESGGYVLAVLPPLSAASPGQSQGALCQDGPDPHRATGRLLQDQGMIVSPSVSPLDNRLTKHCWGGGGGHTKSFLSSCLLLITG